MRTFISIVLFAILAVACASNSSIDKGRSHALDQYESMIRWSEWDGAINFIAPEYLEEHPISNLELERLRLFRVTAYTVRSTQLYDEGLTMTQVVEIRLFHKARAVERSITDQQLWRYDPESERWLLHSDLPDPTRKYLAPGIDPIQSCTSNGP
jgi:hypothetical protein